MFYDEAYKILQNGPGSPGETTRELTKEYVRLKNQNILSAEICEDLLLIRAEIFRSLGIEIYQEFIDTVLHIADGHLPFVIFADVYISNVNNLQNNFSALVESLTIIIRIITEEYNKLCINYPILDKEILIDKIARFMYIERGEDFDGYKMGLRIED